jgi:molybdopterin molybdotransferase
MRPGENRRRRGEDLAAGKPAVRAGRLLKPADLGLIGVPGHRPGASVFRRLRVALFSTGNELRTLGQALDPGSVYDSNRYSLMGALQRLGMPRWSTWGWWPTTRPPCRPRCSARWPKPMWC